MKKVLVLEDESSIRSFIVINLRRAGYEVIEAGTGEEALEMLQQHSDIRVALLDVMLPGIDGFEVCRRIRATNSRIGIIMLTARSQEMDKVTGLMTGADDYVTKPFSPAELTARVDALMRRSGGSMEEHSGEISQPPFLLNTRNRTLEKNGKPVKLTQVEYSIMRMFMENPGKALSREEILDLVEGSEDGDPHWCHRVDQGGHRGPGEGDPQLDEEDSEEIAHDPHPGKVFPVRPVDLHAEVLPGHEHQGK